MLHVHFARMWMYGRREVTHKTLAETRTVRKKKNPTPNLQVIFCSKHFFGKPCTVQEKGLRQKSL